MGTKSETIFLLGAGFTKAAILQSPLNTELLEAIPKEGGSTLAKYKNKYETNDISREETGYRSHQFRVENALERPLLAQNTMIIHLFSCQAI